jgi:hypothetical protein
MMPPGLDGNTGARNYFIAMGIGQIPTFLFEELA